jgi:hypothetical protein
MGVYESITEGSEALIAECLYGIDGGRNFYSHRRGWKVIQ